MEFYDKVEKETQLPSGPREEESQDAWLMSYADMITLLLGFFAVLLSMSTFDKIKMEMFSQYFSGEQSDRMTMSQLQKQIEQFVMDEKLGDQVKAKLTMRGVEISFKDRILFGLGKAELKEGAVPILTKISDLLNYQQLKDRKVIVEGHTDSLPIKSVQFPTNWELSSARAAIVVRYFMSQGLTGGRFEATGYADTRPANLNTDRLLGQPENRRVVVIISPDSYITDLEMNRKEIATVGGSTVALNKELFEQPPTPQAEQTPVPISSNGGAEQAVEEEAAQGPVQVIIQKKAVKKAAKQAKVRAPAPAPEEAEPQAPVAVKPVSQPKQVSEPIKIQPTDANFIKSAQHASKDVDALYSAGLKYMQQGDNAMALQSFKKVLEINPKHTPSILKVKKLNKELGQQ
jgi:chemotaxis protein MotB